MIKKMATMEEQNEIAIQARDFRNKVDSMLETEEERGKLLDALRNYHESKKIKRLVRDLKIVLDTTKKYPLFKEIRALIPPEHLFAYDKLTEGARTGERIAHLKRHGNEPLGFKFKGGKEHGIGVYVTSVIPGSAAHASGLRIGDEILKVNGLVLHESIHDEVTNLIKNKRSVTFVTRSMGKIPNKENNRIVWQEIDPNMRIGPPDLWDSKFVNLAIGQQSQVPNQARRDDRMLAFKIGKEGLGCSIGSGIAGRKGIYVSAVSTNSLADQVGLKIGDQILNVNGRGFENVKHSEAVEALKARRELTMIVRYNEEVAEHFKRKKNHRNKALLPILLKEGEERERKKKASFGENVIVEVIECPETSNEEEVVEEEDEDIANVEPGKSNFEYDEEVTQGKDVHFVSILKTAPLMLDLEMKNERIVIRNVIKGGAVSDNGFLKRGDVLLNVEGVDLVGLNLVEAQEALSDAMGRLANHIDIVVACPPGRKPPVKPGQSILNQAEEATHPFGKRRPSVGLSDDETAQLSAVAKAIAQFESNFPKKNQFLLRRDSLEKARNSLRLYKEKKRNSVFQNYQSDGSPRLSHSTESSSSPSRIIFGNFNDTARTTLGSDLSPSLNKKSAFSMPDPAPIAPLFRAHKQMRSFDSSGSSEKMEEEIIVISQNDTFTSNQVTSPHFKSLSDEISDLSLENPANEQMFAAASNTNSVEKLRSVGNSTSEMVKKRAQGNIPFDEIPSSRKLESFSNRHEVRAQVHSPPLASNDDMLVSWSPTSPLRNFSNSVDKKSVTFKQNDASNREFMLSPTGRSRSMDDLVEEIDRVTENPRQRQARKKSVGFKDTVENIHPPDFTLYKSLDDISMIGKNGWGKSKNREKQTEHPGSKLSPKKSALRNSPSPVPKSYPDGRASGQSKMEPDNTSAVISSQSNSDQQSTNVLDIKKRFEDDSALPSHLKMFDDRFQLPHQNYSGQVSGQDARELTAESQNYKTYHSIFSASPKKDASSDDVAGPKIAGLQSDRATAFVKSPTANHEFLVSGENEDSKLNDEIHQREKENQVTGPRINAGVPESGGVAARENTSIGLPESRSERSRENKSNPTADPIILGKYDADNLENVSNKPADSTLLVVPVKSVPNRAIDHQKANDPRKEAVEIPEPDYDKDEVTRQPQPQQETPASFVQPDVKSKRKDNSLGLTTRLLSNAKEKLKRVGFKRSSTTANSDSVKTRAAVNTSPKFSKAPSHHPPTAQSAPPPAPAPPPPPPPPPILPPATKPFSSTAVVQQQPNQSLLEQLQTSPVRKPKPKDGPKESESESSERSGGSHARKEVLLTGSMHAGIASEQTENVKIAAVVAGDDSGPRMSSEKPSSKFGKHPPMNDLLNELKGKVKSHESRARSASDEKGLTATESRHIGGKFPKDQGLVSNERNIPHASAQQPGRVPSDVRDTRISRRQAQGVAELDSNELSSNITSVTPRTARVEKEKALLEMEGTLKAFDDVIRSLDTEL